MNNDASQAGVLRLGVVPYLNVQPLIWMLRQADPLRPQVVIRTAAPRRLAKELRSGKHDAAIVPVFEHLQHPGRYDLVPGIAIGCNGPVRSVVLYTDCALPEVRFVQLDPASLTSVNLLKVLLAEMGHGVQYRDDAVEGGGERAANTGRLLIGDPALHARSEWAYAYDLGAMWYDQTGLPFVFAVWLAQSGADNQGVAAVLEEAARWGIEHFDRVATECAGEFGVTREYALEYFRDSISYALGPRELQAMELFRSLCIRHGLLST